MTQPTLPAKPAPPDNFTKSIRGYLICVLVGALLTGIPLGIRLYQLQRDRTALQEQVEWAELEIDLARASVMARHGDYAAARDAASSFFSRARLQLDAGGDLSAPERTYLQSVLTERDTIITLFARGDPAGAERTTAMYVAYRGARATD
jgi:hypothetical protein